MNTNQNVTRYPQKAIRDALTQFHTPFFLYEEAQIRENCRAFQKSFGKYFPHFTPLYAVKANANPHIIKIILDEGFGLDCSSPSEVWLADKLGAFGMHTGNYSTVEEIQQVLEVKNMLLNLDDISLLDTLQKLDVPEFLSFRINPGISGATQESLIFAGEEAKYGIPWEDAVRAYKKAQDLGVKRFGIHMMTGSNVLDESYFSHVTTKLLAVVEEIYNECDIEFEYINIGGGFGVPYRPTEDSLDLDEIARALRKVFDNFAKRYTGAAPRLMVEPGRMIMADAGFLVTSVNVIKESYKKFAGVDAGMNDLPRPAMYGAYHHISVLGKDMNARKENVNIVGRLCENNDQFARDRALPVLHVGDVVVIHAAGAHAYAMGHNYNGRTRSDEYLLTQHGAFKHIRRAETIEDLYRTVPDLTFDV